MLRLADVELQETKKSILREQAEAGKLNIAELIIGHDKKITTLVILFNALKEAVTIRATSQRTTEYYNRTRCHKRNPGEKGRSSSWTNLGGEGPHRSCVAWKAVKLDPLCLFAGPRSW